MLRATDRIGCYPSDLGEAQWESIRKLLPDARSGGRKRSTSTRAVLNGIIYLVRNGCSWRHLPLDYPPWPTVYGYFRAWKHSGVWEEMNSLLTKMARAEVGKEEDPSCAAIDTQSVKAQVGEDRGRDGFKHITGRKRHIVTDTLGLIHKVRVHAADLLDEKEAKLMFKDKSEWKRLKVLYADLGYRGGFPEVFKQRFGFYPTMRKRKGGTQGKRKKVKDRKKWNKEKESLLKPMRWVVERTFGWFNHYRRLSKDYERTTSSSESVIYIAMSTLILNRLFPRHA